MAEPLKTEAVALSPEAVTEAVQEVDWKKLCTCLCVPDSKRHEIETNYPPIYHRRVLVDWWFSTDPAPSWRRLIYRLDAVILRSETADKICCNAEPVQDPTFTLHNVSSAVGNVENWSRLYHLGVPSKRRGSKEEMLRYFITTVPDASWQTLAGGLYYAQEHAALENVMKHFQPQPEATLTFANLCSLLEEIVEWDDLGRYLGVPESVQRGIKKKHSTLAECRQAMLEEWRNHHPAPCWMTVANALYSGYICGEWGKYHKVLQLLKEKYLTATLPEQPVSSTRS